MPSSKNYSKIANLSLFKVRTKSVESVVAALLASRECGCEVFKSVSSTCTFILFMYWQYPEEIAGFRDPAKSDFAAGNRELDAH
jgi:hypothetical protein